MNSLNLRIFNTILLSAISALLFVLPIKTGAAEAIRVEEERTSITQFSADYSYSALNGYGSSLSVPESQNSFSYTTDRITPEQDVNALGVLFSGDFDHKHSGGHAVQVLAHIQTAEGKYTVELPILHGDGKSAHTADTLSTSPVMVEEAESYTIEITLLKNGGDHSSRIDSMEVIALNTGQLESAGLNRNATSFSATSSNSLSIISRQEWGADESYRFVASSNEEESTEDAEENTSDTNNENGEEIWPVELQDKKAFIVHHTAGTDGGSDPSASVRAIYYWHAVVLGWGDIGYNYLIDPDGNVYEGRYGGVQAKGAHAYNSVDKLDYNENTVGIALLGCFEETPGACHTVHTSTEEMDDALAELIGVKAVELGIDPDTTTTLHNEEIARVVGHRDVDYTYCPGSAVHNNLDVVRTAAAAVYQDENIIPLGAEYVGAEYMSLNDENEPVESIGRRSLIFSESYQVTITYENTGVNTWTQEDLKLKAFHKNKKKISPMRHEEWAGKYAGVRMNEEIVAPGETASFTFLLSSPKKPGNKQLFTKLYHDGEKVKTSNAFNKVRFTSLYDATTTLNSAPLASFVGDTHTIEFTITNDGENDWPEENLELFSNGSVVESVTVPSLAVGESTTLSFEWTAPESATVYYLRARVKQNGYRIPGTRFATGIRVDEL